ncbi:MAG: hypothetical protein LBV59_04675 [Sphingobacterium sp.]|jgi:hypothetical protein|uniref:tellurite resistance TerB C-terminal domain-containing protein n=1 Tax=Sphingobacterium sp. TaxID=341027 RepID=UPI00284621E0|nr:tellurite resistance TerB C-terminal domain-containing protein [Sphingobacterium sp.]MDR3007204.1 hypothetical protein [Sphingobacterium sp.]
MGTFFIILIFIVIALAASSKKNKKKQQQQYYAPPKAQEQPTAAEMKNANFYYGEGWRQYLITHHGKYELWPPNFFEIAAIALRKLSIKENYDLKIHFNHREGSQLLYNLTLRLLRNRQYNSENVGKAYRIVIDTIQKLPASSPLPPIPKVSENKPTTAFVQENVVMNNVIPSIQSVNTPQALKSEEETADVKLSEVKVPIQTEDSKAEQDQHGEIAPILDSLNVNNRSDETHNDIIDVTSHREEIISTQAYNLDNSTNTYHEPSLNIEEVLAKLDDSNLFAVTSEKMSIQPAQQSYADGFENNYNYDDYLLGKRYKDKMGLSKAQVSLLNKLTGVNNVFLEVEGCCIDTIALFLSGEKKLRANLTKKDSNLKKEIENLVESARKISRVTKEGAWMFDSYYNQKYVNDIISQQVYYTIFKRAETLVREKWGHKRKVSGDFSQTFTGLSDIFEERIGSDVNTILENLKSSIKDPDLATEIELNRMNTTRWKSKFDVLKSSVKQENIVEFGQEIHTLFEENQLNPSAENIYYEACKIAYTIDKNEAIKLYLHYLYADLRSDKIDDKQLTKTIHKTLFKNDHHEQAFNDIIQQLKKDRNLATAIEKVDSIYAPIRRKIELNIEAIKTVQEQDKNTVELLNNYLQDEEEIIENAPVVFSSDQEGTAADVEPTEIKSDTDNLFVDELDLSLDQRELIGLFTANSFELTQEYLANFCKSRGLRSGPMINDINEICYEILDDTLIEERDEEYLDMNEDYYKMIIKA